MKTTIKITLNAILFVIIQNVNAQNTFPSSGPVGIGTIAPQQLLHINAPGTGLTYTLYTNNGGGYNDGFHVGVASDGTADLLQKRNKFLRFYTFNTLRAYITTGSALTNPAGLSGDGLRILDPTFAFGNLDLWTSSSNTTHIQFDGSGNIDGQNNRFEMTGNYSGLWFNAKKPEKKLFYKKFVYLYGYV